MESELLKEVSRLQSKAEKHDLELINIGTVLNMMIDKLRALEEKLSEK